MVVLSITETVSNWAVSFMDMTGYTGIVFLMALESMVAPIPSEAVMPFAGFLIVQQKFTWTGVIVFSTVGSILGSYISYWVGMWGGRPVILKWGKYLLLDKHHLEITENYFNKRGEITILISRFIPVVRHLISIPAGIAKMNFLKFTLYTIIGAGIWNTFLAWVGFRLKEHWDKLLRSDWKNSIDIVFVAIILIICFYILYKLVKDKKRRNQLNEVNNK
jgi:membrane protein DedA with SNARE-associated domain